MMAGNPKYYWSMSDMLHPQPNSHDQFVYPNTNNSSSLLTDHHTQDFPVRSWSQLLLGGGEEEEDQVLNLNASRINDHDHAARSWPQVSSSPSSCLTSLSSNNFFNFAGENSSECNSTNTGGVSKRARVSSQPPLKVRKEKLGDRITALHQLVSPFGKTDTASVLSEAIGYIRFLQAQIQALSAPYMRNSSSPNSDSENRGANDLSSRGLCLVPISCTDSVGDDNGADYWASAALGGGF